MLSISSRGAVGRAEKPKTLVRGQSSRLPWAWNGLCFGVPFNQSSDEGARDIVNNVTPTLLSNVTWTRDSGGNTAANMSNTSYIQYPDNPAHDRPSTELTVCVRLKWAGTSDTWGALVENRIASVDPWDTWAIAQVSTNSGYVGGSMTINGVNRTVGNAPLIAAPITTTQFCNVFLRWRSGELMRIDIFGERGQTIAAVDGDTVFTGTITYQAGEAIRINAGDDSANNFSGHYSQVMVWNRRLTTTEMVWMIQDPFGWYSPRRETIGTSSPYPLIAGAGEMRSGGGGGGLY